MTTASTAHGALPARIEAHLDQTGECWVWTGNDNGVGYGTVSWHGQITYVHRIAYEHAIGPIPAGMLVCHTCDNPPCCNPAHLFLGTKRDNGLDMGRKGRGSGLLNTAQVSAIRARLSRGDRQVDIGRALGIGWWVVQDIARGRCYAWVGEEGESA